MPPGPIRLAAALAAVAIVAIVRPSAQAPRDTRWWMTEPIRSLQTNLSEREMAVVGTMDQADRTGLAAARPVFAWHAAHEDLYVGQRNAARVLLVATGETAAYRGFFRLLSEQHVPFEVSTNLGWLDDPTRRFDLVI